MKDKQLTCKTYLKQLDETKVVACLDSDDPVGNQLVIEPGETYDADCHYPWGQASRVCKMPDRHYLVGEVADRLYAYEQLGYSPEELREIIRRYQMYRTSLNSVYGITVMPARQNGKSRMELAKILGAMEEMQDEYERFCKGEWPKKNPTLDIRDLYPSTMIVPRTPEPENVIFNDPATIVFWKDGTKTVVKATNEDFDPEKGLAMAIAKKALGNKGNYFNTIKKWTERYEAPTTIDTSISFAEGCARAADGLKKLADSLRVKKEDTP